MQLFAIHIKIYNDDDANTIANFINDKLLRTINANVTIQANKLYLEFTAYCEQYNKNYISIDAFDRHMITIGKHTGIGRTRTNDDLIYTHTKINV